MRSLRRFRCPLLLLLGLGVILLLLTALQPSSPPVSFAANSNAPLMQSKTFVVNTTMQGEAFVVNTKKQAGACQHSGLAPDIAMQEFGWAPSYLNQKYLKTTLCDDTLLSMTTVVCKQAKQLFQQLGWPVDLLIQPYDNQTVCTKAHQPQNNTTNGGNNSNTGGDSCIFSIIPNVSINFCAALEKVIQSVSQNMANGITQGVQTITNQTEGLVGRIPEQATYQNPAVTHMWGTMVLVADVLVVLLVLWTGLRYLLDSTSAVEYASLIEIIPRLLLTLLLVHFSMTLAQFTIDLTNALCAAVGEEQVTAAMVGGNDNLNLFVSFLAMFRSLLALVLILQAAIELAGIAVAIPAAPLCLLCLFHPDTQRIAKTWISLFGALCLMRFFQVLALELGYQLVTAAIMKIMPNAEFINAALGIGVLIIAAMIPGFLRQWLLVPISGGGRAVASAFTFFAFWR
jgi:hypothetical protein